MPDIEIFSGPDCSYCAMAKALLDQRGLAYREFDVAASAEHLASFRRRLPREKALPQIIVDGVHIGGAEDLQQAFDTGLL